MNQSIFVACLLLLVYLCNGRLPTCNTGNNNEMKNSQCALLTFNENNHQNTKYGYVCCKCGNEECPSSGSITYQAHTKANNGGWTVTSVNGNNANDVLCPGFCKNNVAVDANKLCVYTGALKCGMVNDANTCGQAYLGEKPNHLFASAKNGYINNFEYYDEDDDYYMDDDEYFINYISDESMLDDFMEQFKLQQENAYYRGYQNGYIDAKKEIKQKKQLLLKRDIHKHGKTHFHH